MISAAHSISSAPLATDSVGLVKKVVRTEEAAKPKMKDRSRDSYADHWRNVEPVLGHLYIEEIKMVELDRLVASLPRKWAAKKVNHRLALVRTVLRFMWERELLASVPKFPMLPVPEHFPDWYSEEERDQLLDGLFQMCPEWYAFFYITMRMGLRRAEVYAIAHDRVRTRPPQLIIDQSVQEGRKSRPSKLIRRKNDEVLVLALPSDVHDAIRWHIQQGFSGRRFLFSRNGTWSQKIQEHERPLRRAQEALGLRVISHHKLGRHSVASQAASGGHSIKHIQAQLGHRDERSTAARDRPWHPQGIRARDR